MAAVTFEHATKTYRSRKGDVAAVDDLNLAVADREFMVLLGPSGCGKTTALRLVAGLEELTAGAIRIGARVVNNVAPKDRDVAMVFQNYALYPHMSVYKNLAFGLRMRKVPRSQIRQTVQETAILLGIEHLLDRKPAALSGGERQRVAVGRAIVRKPTVFLFDEPLSNLDAGLRVRMRTEIKRLHQRLQATMIFVTHDQEEAMMLGERIAIMDRGRIQQCAPPLEVYRHPASRFIAGFVGTPPMNFFSAQIDDRADLIIRTEKGWETDHPAPTGPHPSPDVGRGIHGNRLELPESTRSILGGHRGERVIVGVRPEDLRISDPHAGGTPELLGPWKVTEVQHLGNTTFVTLLCDHADPVIVRASADLRVSSGEVVTVHVNSARIHLFSADDQGQRLN